MNITVLFLLLLLLLSEWTEKVFIAWLIKMMLRTLRLCSSKHTLCLYRGLLPSPFESHLCLISATRIVLNKRDSSRWQDGAQCAGERKLVFPTCVFLKVKMMPSPLPRSSSFSACGVGGLGEAGSSDCSLSLPGNSTLVMKTAGSMVAFSSQSESAPAQ